MVQLIKDGNLDEARELHYKYLRIFNDIFIETNPIPIKTAMSMRGFCEESFRLPLCEMRPENREKTERLLKDYNLL